jgi:hypothetical protein
VTTPPTRRISRRSALKTLAAALAAGATTPARATHLPDHRFIVLGTVTDGGRPLARAPVAVTRVRTGLDYPTRTEGDGFYFVILHLHDEDEGERLLIRAGAVSGEIRARFDVANKKVERGTRVNIQDGRLVEDRQAFAESLRAYLAR